MARRINRSLRTGRPANQGADHRLRVPSYFIPVVGAGYGGFPDEVVDTTGAFFTKVLLGKDVAISTETLYKREFDYDSQLTEIFFT